MWRTWVDIKKEEKESDPAKLACYLLKRINCAMVFSFHSSHKRRLFLALCPGAPCSVVRGHFLQLIRSKWSNQFSPLLISVSRNLGIIFHFQKYHWWECFHFTPGPLTDHVVLRNVDMLKPMQCWCSGISSLISRDFWNKVHITKSRASPCSF